MHYHRRHLARIAGFTLVELMISLGVVSAIAATQVPIYLEQKLPQRQALEAKADVEAIKAAANSYFMVNGAWPANLNSLINAGYLPGAWPTTGSPYSLSTSAPTGTGAEANTNPTLVVSIETLSARQASYLDRQLPYATIATDGVTVETSMGQPTLGAIQANWLSRTHDNNCGAGGNDCNTMQTDIDAGDNNINDVASIDANRVEIVDPNAAANAPVASITATGLTLNLNDGVNVSGDLTVADAIDAKDSLTVDGALQANSTATVADELHAQDSLTVDGAFQANSTVTVVGALHAQDSLTVDGAFLANSSATVAGALHAQDSLTVDGALHAKDNLTVDGALHAKNTLTVDGALHAKNDLSVDGLLNAGTVNAVTLNADNANLTGALSALQINIGTDGASISATGSTLNLGPSVNIAGNLGIQGDLAIAGDFGVGGDFNVDGTLTTDDIVTDTITLESAVNAPQLNVGNTSINSDGNTLNLNAETILINGKLKLGGTLNANNHNITGVDNLEAASATITDLTATNATIKDTLTADSAELGKTSISNGLTVSGTTELQKLTATELNVTEGEGKGTFKNVNVSNQLTATNSALENSTIGKLKVTGDTALNSLSATSASISGKITAETADIKVSEFDTLYVNKYLYAKTATLATVKATNVTTDFLTTGSFSATSVNVSGAFNVGGTLNAQNATITEKVTANSLESTKSGLGTATATSLNAATIKAADIDATTVKGGSFTAHSYTASDDFTTADSSVNTNKTLIDKYAALWAACEKTGGCK